MNTHARAHTRAHAHTRTRTRTHTHTGLSAREISKLLLGLQARVYGSAACRLDAAVLQAHFAAAIRHQKRKRELVERGVTF